MTVADTAALTEAARLSEEANGPDGYGPICLHCKRRVFWLPGPYALVPGHIYSEDGIREAGITRICEFCFDTMFQEDEDL